MYFISKIHILLLLYLCKSLAACGYLMSFLAESPPPPQMPPPPLRTPFPQYLHLHLQILPPTASNSFSPCSVPTSRVFETLLPPLLIHPEGSPTAASNPCSHICKSLLPPLLIHPPGALHFSYCCFESLLLAILIPPPGMPLPALSVHPRSSRLSESLYRPICI
jgi:hypothetical protein